MQSQSERDFDGLAAKKEREAIPEERFDDPVTGNYEGEELRAMREKRPPADRISRLEEKHDELVKEVTETRLEVAAMSGKLEVLPRLVDLVEKAADAQHLTFTAKVEVDKAEKLDAIDARKAKRQLIAKVAGLAAVAGAALGKLLHMLGVF